MTRVLLLVLSAALIVSGVALVWRDLYRRRREAFLVRGDATAIHPDVELTVAHLDPTSFTPLGAAGGEAPSLVEVGKEPEPAAQWAAIQPVLSAAVERVNGVLAGANVTIGASGEPSRSLMKRGYGVHRRILVSGESVAWLRIELDGNGELQASIKAHKDEHAALNTSASTTALSLNVERASDLFSRCLKPVAGFAMRSAHGGRTEQWASEMAWKEIAPLLGDALRAANGALAQAATRFTPLGAPAWSQDVQRHRLSIAIEVLGSDAARMLIERIDNDIEIAVGLPEAHLAHLGRRHRIPLAGLTTHALAEQIASCAWPTIAHFRETPPLA
ncbi:MAG TPA: hypothetical protein VFZ16_08330 [Hyphomicrobiaceae bacterium]|nr:hypothetical protein [Hyphomicrobiaceae bacterium]